MKKTMLLVLVLLAPAAWIACGAPSNQQAENTGTDPNAAAAPATPSTQPQEEAGSAQQPSATAQRPSGQGRTATRQPSGQQPSSSGSGAPPSPTASAHRPVEPPRPQMVEVPAGTVLEMELIDDVSTKTSVAGDAVRARITDAVSVGGEEVIPAGSTVEGKITEAVSAKKLSGQASLSMEFTTLALAQGGNVPISAVLTQKGKKRGGTSGAIIGGSAAGGAVLGRIIGKNTKGALLGAAVGAGAGTAVAANKKGQELKLPAGTGISVELASPARVPVPSRNG